MDTGMIIFQGDCNFFGSFGESFFIPNTMLGITTAVYRHTLEEFCFCLVNHAVVMPYYDCCI